MYSAKAMRAMSPHERAKVYKNQTVGAVWILLGVGIITLASPLLRLGASLGVEPGLVAPVALGRLAGQAATSPLVNVLAASGGAVLVALGVLLGVGRAHAALVGALVLLLDWPFVLVAGRAGDFPELLTSVLRLFALFYVLRGWRAVRLRRELQEKLQQADAEYDEELKARARRRGRQDGQPVDSRFEPEDDYQG